MDCIKTREKIVVIKILINDNIFTYYFIGVEYEKKKC